MAVNGDTTVEHDETFFVNLTGSSSNATITDNRGQGTILNDDQAPPPPATLDLSPVSATNNVGQQHCVTASVKDNAGRPVPNVVVRFSVSGPNSSAGSDTTATSGEARFCYTGANAGDDTIRAFADSDGNGTQGTGEPGDEATKKWVGEPPVGVPGCDVEGKGWIRAANGDTATFKIDVGGAQPEGKVRYKVHGAQGLHLKSTEITQILVSSDQRTATILGQASVKQDGSVQFRIDVKDLPNAPDTFRIRFGAYDSGEQRIRQHDVDIDCEDDDHGNGNGKPDKDKKK